MSPPARFAASYAAAFAVFGLAAQERRVVAYLVVLGLCALAARAAHRVARFAPRLCWAISIAGLLHMAGGLLPGNPILYETWLIDGVVKYDQAAHFAIVAAATFAAWQLVGVWLRADVPTSARALLAVTTAVGLGAANEVFEFLSALRFADAYVGNLSNAGWDLVFNLAGAVSAGFYLAISSPAPSSRGSRTARAVGAGR